MAERRPSDCGCDPKQLPSQGREEDSTQAYSVLVDSMPGGKAVLQVVPAEPLPERFPSPVPRELFSETLAEQEKELATSGQMHRFAASRQRLAADRYRPAYHFVSPESQLNDPNGLRFWQGRWHLFYQAYPPDEFPDPKDIAKRRQHWGHAVSQDLIHGLAPLRHLSGRRANVFSGSALVEATRVVAYYPVSTPVQMVAVSKDPLLPQLGQVGGRPVKAGRGFVHWKEGKPTSASSAPMAWFLGKSSWTGRLRHALEGNPFRWATRSLPHLFRSAPSICSCPSAIAWAVSICSATTTRGSKLKTLTAHGVSMVRSSRFHPGGYMAAASAADGKGG